MRRLLLAPGLVLSLLLSSAAPAQIVAQSGGDPVRTDAGLVDGKTLPSGVRAWLGVPFAAPPVRDLRWRDPQPHARWDGVWHADRPAPECIQPLRARNLNHYFGEEPTSEDCLYLNIWAPPGPAPAGGYPVVTWIYGGGFNIGSASMANYAGEALAAMGVVYVAIAYRVGPLGFLAHPELSAENGGKSGNYGLKDQVAALRWIKSNIVGFGGNPANVTIAGQSAGSMSVSLLQASPTTKGLFQRAVGMSGGAFGGIGTPAPLKEAEVEGLAVQKALAVQSIEQMRDMPADKLIALAAPVRRRPIVIDGDVVVQTPAAAFAAGRQNDVPLLLGFTRDESFRSLGPISSAADYEAAVRRAFPDKAEAILKRYPAGTVEEARRRARDIERDSTLNAQMAQWALAQSATGKAPVRAYFFTRVHPYRPGVPFADHDPATVGAYHSADIPYWLGTLDSLNLFRTTRDWTPVDQALSGEMMDHLVAFARSGKPNANWPAFTPRKPVVLQLGETRSPIPWPHFADWSLFGDAPPPTDKPRIRD
ncbi:carboxylesterase [Sphingobium sp. Leaf26]|uniref:carboxylesterase/lipase family protein n=1 Tax=Sphingobium sp. Leaf26 TaxID=1735693 RepID=UPI0006F79F39|nr:carboxylesterase family protein [Sphingobium sp. Leaf26]KQM97477.1 carboxylesterase [Sphingobium sp. Leaf26]